MKTTKDSEVYYKIFVKNYRKQIRNITLIQNKEYSDFTANFTRTS